MCILSETDFSGTATNVATALAGKMKTADVNALKSALDKLKQNDPLRKKFSEDGGTSVKNVNDISRELGGQGANGDEKVAVLLLKKEFGISGATVSADNSTNRVTVTAGTSGGHSGNATVTVKKGSDSGTPITIQIMGDESLNNPNVD